MGEDFSARGQAISNFRPFEGPYPRSVIAGDVDSDGDADVLSASFHDDRIAWYESDLISEPWGGDFDGDGDVDSADRTILNRHWTGALPRGSGSREFAQGDADDDGDVDSADLTILVQSWTGALRHNDDGEIELQVSRYLPSPERESDLIVDEIFANSLNFGRVPISSFIA